MRASSRWLIGMVAVLVVCCGLGLCENLPPPEPGVYRLTPQTGGAGGIFAGHVYREGNGLYKGWVRVWEDSSSSKQLRCTLTVTQADEAPKAQLNVQTIPETLEGEIRWNQLGAGSGAIIFGPATFMGQQTRFSVLLRDGQLVARERQVQGTTRQTVSVFAELDSCQGIVPTGEGTYTATFARIPFHRHDRLRLQYRADGKRTPYLQLGLRKTQRPIALQGFGDKLLQFTIDEHRTRLIVGRYEGDTSTLRLKATDGRGEATRDVTHFTLFPKGMALLFGYDNPAETIEVPSGAYQQFSCTMPTGEDGEARIMHRRRFKVRGGTVREIKCGGPVHLSLYVLEHEGRQFTAKVWLRLPHGGMLMTPSPTLVVKGPDGEVLHTDELRFGASQEQDYAGKLPGSQTGRFTIEAVLDLGEYQGEVRASEEITVE